MGGDGQHGGSLKTCMYCGRDTKARGGVCASCLGGSHPFALKATGHGEQEEFPPLSFPDQQYHGDTERDDL